MAADADRSASSRLSGRAKTVSPTFQPVSLRGAAQPGVAAVNRRRSAAFGGLPLALAAERQYVGQTGKPRTAQDDPMKDVTDRLNAHRECIRQVWNSHLLPVVEASPEKWNAQEQFDPICWMLFDVLVGEPLAVPWRSRAAALRRSHPSGQVIPWLQVVPGAAAGVPIMINRDPTQDHGYWDHPLKRVAPADVDLRFVDWFDFDALAFRDFKYCRVRVVASLHSEIVGRAALLECEYGRFVLDEDALVAPAVVEH